MDKTNKENQEDPFKGFLDDFIEDVKEADAVLLREVTPFGNSGHINVGKEFVGKNARIIITSRPKGEYFEIKKFKLEDGKK